MSITKNEQAYYDNINGIAKALDRIANALEKNNEIAHNVKHAFTGMDGKQVDEEVELDTQHDYLHQLVKNLNREDYHEFCNEHCLPASDAVAVSNYITDLDYDEVLGIISDLEAQNAVREGYKMSNDQANEDVIKSQMTYEYENNDRDLRETAKMYTNELLAGNFRTKKECILDYVTNEFGSQGARYTDIIKFAYYLGAPNASKFGYKDRGYYACALTHGRWNTGHLVTGGKDQLVKGVNKEGDERYFALSFVESATDYWKYLDR